MTVLMAMVVGGLYAAGLYLILRRSLVKLVLGLCLLSHGANLLIFTAGGLTREKAPLVAPGASMPDPAAADPVPQALVLTAIVIASAVLAFALVLAHRTYQALNNDDLDRMKATDTCP